VNESAFCFGATDAPPDFGATKGEEEPQKPKTAPSPDVNNLFAGMHSFGAAEKMQYFGKSSASSQGKTDGV
jgi:hypothetical protein